MSNKPSSANPEPFHKQLFAESDRGCILIAHATIDKTLESLVRLALSMQGKKNKRLALRAKATRGVINSLLLKNKRLNNKSESATEDFADQPSYKSLFESSRGPLASTWGK